MRFRHRLEFIGLKIGLGLFRLLPPRARVDFGTRLGAAWYALDRARRQTAIANIVACRIADTTRARSIARASFMHFGALIAEALQYSSGSDPDIISDIHPETQALLEAPGQGMLVVSGHIGNWELAAQHLARTKPVVGIAKAMKNPLSDRLIKTLKTSDRFQLIPMRDADAGRFFKVLKSGKILALLADQYAKGDRFMHDFFGMPTSVHPSPALLHLITRTPICFGVCWREGPMRYRFTAGAPWVHTPTGNREADVRAVLTRLNQSLEAAICERPEQYLWAHRRWRTT